MGNFIGKIIGNMLAVPLGNIILGALVAIFIGIPIYGSQNTWAWIIVGIVITAIGILRLVIDILDRR